MAVKAASKPRLCLGSGSARFRLVFVFEQQDLVNNRLGTEPGLRQRMADSLGNVVRVSRFAAQNDSEADQSRRKRISRLTGERGALAGISKARSTRPTALTSRASASSSAFSSRSEHGIDKAWSIVAGSDDGETQASRSAFD
jgi:hypothetical protein